MVNEIRILIADDHPVFRKGLRQVIEADPELKVIGEADDGTTALGLIETLAPDVAVLDIHMPKMGGFALMKEVQERKLSVLVIFLTMYKDEAIFNHALELGVKGYVLKDSAIAEIINSIKAVATGEPYITPALSKYLLNRSVSAVSPVEPKPALETLTPTERKVLRLIGEYKTSKEIGRELFIHPRTVDNHRTNICTKLNIHGSHALLKFALTHKSEIS